MKRFAIAFGLLLTSAVGKGQQPASVTVNGGCNGTASGSNITVTVNCDASLSKEQAKALAKQYAEILRKIQQDKISFAEVMDKLDSIQKGINDLTAATAHRHLSPYQIEALKNRLGDVSQKSMLMMYPMNDPEATGYMNDFQKALALPEANLIRVGTIGDGIGLHLSISPRYFREQSPGKYQPYRLPRDCSALQSLLDDEHIDYTKSIQQGQSASGDAAMPACIFTVGAKPS